MLSPVDVSVDQYCFIILVWSPLPLSVNPDGISNLCIKYVLFSNDKLFLFCDLAESIAVCTAIVSSTTISIVESVAKYEFATVMIFVSVFRSVILVSMYPSLGLPGATNGTCTSPLSVVNCPCTDFLLHGVTAKS